MRKSMKLGKDAQNQAAKALDAISAAVGSTLGPQGRPFVFERVGADGRPKPTTSKDGITVLNSLSFDSPIARAVHFFAQQAAAHSVIASGDGTTSTVVLANAVAKAILGVQNKRFGRKQIPQAMARQLRKEAKAAIEAIKAESDMSPEMVRQVALTSSNGDEELVEVALEAVKQTSAYGSILVEKSPAVKERYQVVKSDGFGNLRGYNYNQTFALSCSDLAAENSPFEWENPNVIVFNGNLMVQQQLDAFMRAYQTSIAGGKVRKLVIVCHETTDEICNKLLVFNRKNVQSGGRGVYREACLDS